MYKGKFDAKAKGQSAPEQTLDTILKERDEAIAKRTAKQAALEAGRPARKAPAQKPVAQNSAPARQQRQAPAKSGVVSENQKTQAPRKKGPRIGGIIFYTFYFLFIFAFFVGVFGVLNWLNGWLKAYESAQPTVKSQQVFNELFGNPDWARLYRMAGLEDTEFEGVSEFAAYMESKINGQELNYVETSAGLSGDKKYLVRAGTEKLGAFTLVAEEQITDQGEQLTDIPDWQFGEVELFVTRNKSIQIKKLENHVAYVNGVPLDDSYTIQIASTRADELLPDGIPSVRTSIQRIDGLMTTPTILVYDETGANQVEVVYNTITDTYEELSDTIVISDEERAAVFGALEAYSGFMINASGSRANLAKYFDGSSAAYSDIIAMGKELWMNSDRGHEFQNEEILGYTKHSDSLFSVRASLNMHVICKDGSEKDYGVTESMIFVKKSDGSWVCNEMTNIDITQPVGQVRLTFCDSDGNTISSDFYATDATMLTTPLVSVPEGKTFSGWSRIDVGEDNTRTWSIVFTPDENGNVYLNDTTLEPMTLYPLFE